MSVFRRFTKGKNLAENLAGIRHGVVTPLFVPLQLPAVPTKSGNFAILGIGLQRCCKIGLFDC